MPDPVPLDELDKAILRALQADARRSNRDVAAAVGVSPTTALDRTRSLRTRGVIRGAVLDVDLQAIGRGVQALISIRVRPPTRANVEQFRAWALALPETLDLFVTSGTEDFLMHVAVADNNALYAMIIDQLTERPEVADVRTSTVFEHLRTNHPVPDVRARRGATERPSANRR